MKIREKIQIRANLALAPGIQIRRPAQYRAHRVIGWCAE